MSTISKNIAPTESVSIDNEGLAAIYLRIPVQEIAYLKFLVESYDDLGILRTLNPEKGEVVILTVKDSLSTLHELLDSLKDNLRLQILPQPEDLTGDWLLSDAS